MRGALRNLATSAACVVVLTLGTAVSAAAGETFQTPTTGQHGSNIPGNSCGTTPAVSNFPGNAISAAGSPFNPSGQSGTVYAGNPGTASTLNANSAAAVSQYDVACANPH